jgi:hypothetical protein
VKWKDSVFSLRYELNISSAWLYCGCNVPAVHVGAHRFVHLSRCYCLRQFGSLSGVWGFIVTCCKNPYGRSELRTDGRTYYFSLFVLHTTIQLTPPNRVLSQLQDPQIANIFHKSYGANFSLPCSHQLAICPKPETN